MGSDISDMILYFQGEKSSRNWMLRIEVRERCNLNFRFYLLIRRLYSSLKETLFSLDCRFVHLNSSRADVVDGNSPPQSNEIRRVDSPAGIVDHLLSMKPLRRSCPATEKAKLAERTWDWIRFHRLWALERLSLEGDLLGLYLSDPETEPRLVCSILSAIIRIRPAFISSLKHCHWDLFLFELFYKQEIL